MKTKISILVFLIAILSFHMDLKAGVDSQRLKVSLSGHMICLLMGDSGLIGVGLNLEFRPSPQFSFGADLIHGIDSDGQAYSCILPAVSYHFDLKSKKTDLFIGVGFNAIIKRYDYTNTYFGSTLLGLGGVRFFFSPHFGVYFRLFITDRIFGGISIGGTYNF
jgi:hypothetical protein